MSKVKAYIDDTVNELVNKVSWPTWKELNSSSVIVMVATLITSMLIYCMDVSFKFVMEMVYGFFR